MGRILSLLGIGRVPISIIMVSLFTLWGGSGLIMMGVLGWTPIQAYQGAALAALLGTGMLSEAISNWIPREESYHSRPADLVGQTAEVLHTVSAGSGTVRMHDPAGNLQDLQARTASGEIPAGTQVTIVRYDEGATAYFVEVG